MLRGISVDSVDSAILDSKILRYCWTELTTEVSCVVNPPSRQFRLSPLVVGPSKIHFSVKLSGHSHKGEECVISIVYNISAWYPLFHTRGKNIYWVIFDSSNIDTATRVSETINIVPHQTLTHHSRSTTSPSHISLQIPKHYLKRLFGKRCRT